MYVYDEANKLAKSIIESREYIEYKKAKEELKSNIEMKDKIEEFENIRKEVQVLSFQGKEQDENKMQKMQELYQILVQDKQIKEFFDIEVRFNIMIADINKIISESIEDVL